MGGVGGAHLWELLKVVEAEPELLAAQLLARRGPSQILVAPDLDQV